MLRPFYSMQSEKKLIKNTFIYASDHEDLRVELHLYPIIIITQLYNSKVIS